MITFPTIYMLTVFCTNKLLIPVWFINCSPKKGKCPQMCSFAEPKCDSKTFSLPSQSEKVTDKNGKIINVISTIRTVTFACLVI